MTTPEATARPPGERSKEFSDSMRGAVPGDGKAQAAIDAARLAAQPEVAGNGAAPEPDQQSRATDGADFAFEFAGEAVHRLWGTDEDVVWASGEPLMVAGPQGVGKTTLVQRLALHRLGIRQGDLLGMPAEPASGRVLYIAADRPKQAGRSLRRMVTEADRQALTDGLIVWKGPLPFDLGRCERGDLAGFVSGFPEVSDVFVDSLKDVAQKLSDNEVGSRVNGEHQELIAQGTELVANHHQRKASGDNKCPTKLDDVYGSTWITAGCGSVFLLWGEAGDPVVKAHHLKQPEGEFGPSKLLHDHSAGSVELYDPHDLEAMVRGALGKGLTARNAAVQLFESDDPDHNQIEKARGKLDRLIKRAEGLERVSDNGVTYYRARKR